MGADAFAGKNTLHWTRMADEILKFMIGHLGLGSNVQLGLVDFKVLQSANQEGFELTNRIFTGF